MTHRCLLTEHYSCTKWFSIWRRPITRWEKAGWNWSWGRWNDSHTISSLILRKHPQLLADSWNRSPFLSDCHEYLLRRGRRGPGRKKCCLCRRQSLTFSLLNKYPTQTSSAVLCFVSSIKLRVVIKNKWKKPHIGQSPAFPPQQGGKKNHDRY